MSNSENALLDAALQQLVDLELDIPCVRDWCYKRCHYARPTKECWRMYLKAKVERDEKAK